ncbi:MAG: glycosyltransferase, partial [Gemmatimonadota bacterium]|nr:glycosyltransferase [Gemmatimonadota bacterium]
HELALAVLGAVVPHKGHRVLVDAIARAGLDGVELLVAGPLGDPAYARELRARADAVPGLRLRLVGPYEPCDLSALLAGVDVLVAPSLWPETFCLVVREALARGVPAITTRLGALPDGVEDGVDGFLYEHDAPAELGTLLRRLAREAGLLARLREGASRSRVTTLDEHVREVRTVY